MSRHHRDLRDRTASLGLAAVLALALGLGSFGTTAYAGQTAADDFDALYDENARQETLGEDAAAGGGVALSGMDLSLDAVINDSGPVAASKGKALSAPAANKPQRVSNRDAENWTWRVVPLLPKYDPDEETTLLQELTPMGLGVVRSF